jgi:hypothetical protein
VSEDAGIRTKKGWTEHTDVGEVQPGIGGLHMYYKILLIFEQRRELFLCEQGLAQLPGLNYQLSI